MFVHCKHLKPTNRACWWNKWYSLWIHAFWIIQRRSSLDSNLQVSQATGGTGQDELETLLSELVSRGWLECGCGARPASFCPLRGHRCEKRASTAFYNWHYIANIQRGPGHKLRRHRLLNRDKHEDIIEARLCCLNIQDNIWLSLVSFFSRLDYQPRSSFYVKKVERMAIFRIKYL